MFDEPMLAGSAGQPSYTGLLLTHFEETRGDDYSIDRLGRSSIDKRVVNYVKPRAEAAGRSLVQGNHLRHLFVTYGQVEKMPVVSWRDRLRAMIGRVISVVRK